MEEFIRQGDIVLLFDNYSVDSQNLQKSFEIADVSCAPAVIEDDGFLPEGVLSIYSYFLGEFNHHEGIPGKPRYFNEINVPDYWEISGTNANGKVQDLYRERGRIYYAEPKHKRLVKVVDWLDERGKVRSCDHYNKYGALYARTIFNAKEQKVNKSYFSADGKEVLVENYVTHDIILNDGDTIRFFHSKVEFIQYVLRAAGFRDNRIFFNSLSTSFFTSEALQSKEKRDILFWQEPIYGEIPGNMQVILQGHSSRTGQVMVQKRDSYDKLIALGANQDIVHRLGYIYPFEKENLHRPEALICTNSEQVEHCHKIVKAMRNVHFHIAALTEMSSKLMLVGAYDNVSLYPGVKMSTLEDLFDQCDYYLDINRESEIVSAVRTAFLHNQLIFAFKETLHNQDCVAEEHIYILEESDKLIADMKHVVVDEKVMKEHLILQHKAAMSEEKESYQLLSKRFTERNKAL